MRCTWIVSGLFLLACGGARTESAQGQRTSPSPESRAAAAAKPHVDAPVEKAQASSDGWFRELIDPSTFRQPVRLQVDRDRISILAIGNGSGFGALLLERGKWSTRELPVAGWILSATWQAPNVPWTLFDAEGGVGVKEGFEGKDELLVPGKSHELAHDISVDPAGIPHVCLSVESSERAKDFVYAARTGTGKSPWQVERVPLPISECRIVATEDAVHIITIGARGVIVVSRTKGDSWKDERWSSNTQGVLGAARGRSGSVALAYSDRSKLTVKKLVAGDWHSFTPPVSGPGVIRTIALAVSSKDQVHFALTTLQERSSILSYAVEGDADAAAIASDRSDDIALELDASDSPHILYTTTPDHQLVHARRRLANDPAPQHESLYVNPDYLLDACATDINVEAGQLQSTFAQGYAHRWCYKDYFGFLPDLNALSARCDTGDGNACLVGGMIATKTEALVSMDLAPCLKSTPCRNVLRKESLLLDFAEHKGDEVLATKLLNQGCELGVGAACLHAANIERHEGRDPSALLTKACSSGRALGCAALLDQDASKISSSVGQQARSTLTRLCKGDMRPEACNALAYMEEQGIGGAKLKTEALRHYSRACELGSAQSCARLLVGPYGKQRAPRGIDASAFNETLSEQCDLHNEAACLALARAFETGWVVARDREQAKSVLDKACEERVEAACKRLGKKVPPAESLD